MLTPIPCRRYPSVALPVVNPCVNALTEVLPTVR